MGLNQPGVSALCHDGEADKQGVSWTQGQVPQDPSMGGQVGKHLWAQFLPEQSYNENLNTDRKSVV